MMYTDTRPTINGEAMKEKYGEKNTIIHEKIRSFGCCHCGRRNGIHMHHVRTRGAIGRVDEWNVVPLCFQCHSNWHTWGRVTWALRTGRDLTALAVDLWKRAEEWYEDEQVGRTEMEGDQGGN